MWPVPMMLWTLLYREPHLGMGLHYMGSPLDIDLTVWGARWIWTSLYGKPPGHEEPHCMASPLDMEPYCRGNPLDMDLTVLGAPWTWSLTLQKPLLGLSGWHYWRPVETCSLPPVLISGGHWSIYGGPKWVARMLLECFLVQYMM